MIISDKFRINRAIIKLFIISAFCLLSCANPQPPPGGPPDTTPPVILETVPASGTTNYKDDEISIKLNKYMNRPKVLENLYLSPAIKYKISWSGKKLIIKFLEPLDTSLTYTVNLGTEYEDYLGNKPESGFTLIFSPGSRIDSGVIAGTLFGEKRVGAFIYAYRIDNIELDTLDIRKTKPLYRIQVGKTGKFQIKALAKGIYRVFAINDVFRNEIYDEGIDLFGANNYDVIVNFDSIPNISLKLGPIIDKNGPMVYSVESINKRFIRLTFSEDIDSSSVKPGSFILTDSSGVDSINIISAYFLHNTAKKVEFITLRELYPEVKWQIFVPAKDDGIRDLSGNIINDTANSKIFIAKDTNDTLKPEIIKLPFADSSANINLKSYFDFVFNIGIDTSRSQFSTTLIKISDSTQSELVITQPLDNIIKLLPSKQLEADNWYQLTIRIDELLFKNEQRLEDTTIILRFKTEDLRQYGSINGKVKIPANSIGDIIIIIKSTDVKYDNQIKADAGGNWKFENIPMGKYNFEVFHDENSNGKYDYGDAFPFRHSERFKIFELEVNVKARWETENVVLNFD